LVRILTAILTALALLAGSGLKQDAAAVPDFLWERPDSAQVVRLRALKHNRFEVNFVDGTKFKGRATVTDSGMVITESHWRNTSHKLELERFARWDEIASIRLIENRHAIRNIVLISASMLVGIYLIYFFSTPGT
jgi:hypothetical protein